MLRDSQILHLLARCEKGVGVRLTQIRGNLKSREWLGAVWELLVIDAALQVGNVKYEYAAPGRGTPDLLVEPYSGARIWIEAAFLRKPRARLPEKLDEQPVFRSLKKKARQASAAKTAEPYVIFVATDRVHEIETRSLPRGLRADEAVRALFASSKSVSAVVLVPILIKPEPFVGFERPATPQLLINDAPRVSLSKHQIDLLNRFDFGRWLFEVFTQPDCVRTSLREFLNNHDGRTVLPPSIDRSLLPPDHSGFPAPCWAYVWRFYQLRIAKFGADYWLLIGNTLELRAKTAEEVAEIAATLFQPYPAHLWGPDAVQLDPDPGVSADLRKWTLEVPG